MMLEKGSLEMDTRNEFAFEPNEHSIFKIGREAYDYYGIKLSSEDSKLKENHQCVITYFESKYKISCIEKFMPTRIVLHPHLHYILNKNDVFDIGNNDYFMISDLKIGSSPSSLEPTPKDIINWRKHHQEEGQDGPLITIKHFQTNQGGPNNPP